MEPAEHHNWLLSIEGFEDILEQLSLTRADLTHTPILVFDPALNDLLEPEDFGEGVVSCDPAPSNLYHKFTPEFLVDSSFFFTQFTGASKNDCWGEIENVVGFNSVGQGVQSALQVFGIPYTNKLSNNDWYAASILASRFDFSPESKASLVRYET